MLLILAQENVFEDLLCCYQKFCTEISAISHLTVNPPSLAELNLYVNQFLTFQILLHLIRPGGDRILLFYKLSNFWLLIRVSLTTYAKCQFKTFTKHWDKSSRPRSPLKKLKSNFCKVKIVVSRLICKL